MKLESAICADKCMSDLDVMDTFINKEVPSQRRRKLWEEPYQGLPDSPDMDDVVDQENNEKSVDTYYPFVGDEVCLPDTLGRKIMA